MSSKNEKAVLKALCYSDIFDYPLTKEEMWKYLICSKNIERSFFEQILQRHSGRPKAYPESPRLMRDPGHIRLVFDSEAQTRGAQCSQARMTIGKKGNFYFLKNRSSIVKTRTRRERESLKKIRIAKKVAGILSKIPTIQLIALSGALAMNNSEKDDDIDFFIITSKNFLWITRLLALVFLQICGYRRRRNETNVSDKVCLNMFLSEEKLDFSKNLRDLYIAHELVQMHILVDKNNINNRFVNSNLWVRKYLPNAFDRRLTLIKTRTNPSGNQLIDRQQSMLEKLAKSAQLVSINRHRTSEIVSDTLLAFHPKDYRKFVLKEYNKRLVKYKLV